MLDALSIHESSAFTMEDIKHLQQFSFKDVDLAYASEGKSLVAYENNQTQANVFGISEKYKMFHQINLKSGSFITSGNKNEMVAVVDENLAIELFNNTNIIGMYVELYSQRFKIIGVIKPDESIVQTLTDNGYGGIYIPVEHMLEYNANSRITSLEIRTVDLGTTGKNIRVMKDALTSIGKNTSDYKIIDYNNERIIVEQKVLLSIFIPGVIGFALLLITIKGSALVLYNTINSALKENYFMDALKLKYVKLSLNILEIMASLTLFYLVWETIKFNIYIPPEYIPSELIDLNFYSELYKSLVQSNIQSIGYVPTLPEMQGNILAVMQKWNLYTYIFVGLPLYYLGLKMLELNQESVVKHLLYCCVFLVLSIAISLLMLFLLKMPVAVNTKGMLVLFVFVFLSVTKKDRSFHGRDQK